MGCSASKPVDPNSVIVKTPKNSDAAAVEARAKIIAQFEAQLQANGPESALEAVLAADADADLVEALAARCALAIVAAPDRLPPPGTYTDVEHIFAALRPAPGSGSGLVPVRLLRTSWIKARAALVRKATSDDERRRLRLPRRQDLERDEPEAFMPVEELEQLKRSRTGCLAAGASSYCWHALRGRTPSPPPPL